MATGQFLGTFTSLAATICMLIYGQLRLDYSMVVNLMTIIGTVIGLWAQQKLVTCTGGKNQFNVFLLVLTILVILKTTSLLTISSMVDKHAEGLPIFAFSSYCPAV